MLQVFHLDVVKVDLDVAYICKCFRCFYMYVASVSSRYCICLQWLHTCFQALSGVLQVLLTYVASVSALSDVCCKCLIWML